MKEPFTCLGSRMGPYGMRYFYLVHRTGCIISLTAPQHIKAHLIRLADLGYWSSNYPMKNKSFTSWDAVANRLFNAQRKIGAYVEAP